MGGLAPFPNISQKPNLKNFRNQAYIQVFLELVQSLTFSVVKDLYYSKH